MKRHCIAVVDDDPAMGAALTRLLRSFGYAPALFGSAEDLLRVLARTLPDCVVTDVQMPGLSGLDLLDRLKARHPALPVILITAYPREANRERALAAGAFAYLPKPFDGDEFERCLDAIFDPS